MSIEIKKESELKKVKHLDMNMISDNVSNTIREYTIKINELVHEMEEKIKSDIYYKYNQSYWCPECTQDFEELNLLLEHYANEHFYCAWCCNE